MDLNKIQEIKQKLSQTDWINQPVGEYKSGSKIKQIEGFELFIRNRDFDDFLKNTLNANSENPHKINVSDMGSKIKEQIFVKTTESQKSYRKATKNDDIFKKSSNDKFTKPCKIKGFGQGSRSPLGSPKPTVTLDLDSKRKLPRLSCFEDYPSLVAIREENPCILIGYDSEWENLPSGSREMLSWQFAVILEYRMIEFCFLRVGEENLSLELALGCILDYLKIPSVDVRKIKRYLYCDSWDSKKNKPILTVTDDVNEARRKCKYIYRGVSSGEVDGWTHELIDEMSDRFAPRRERDWAYFHAYLDYKAVESVKVTLVCHTGLVDLSGFAKNDSFLKFLTAVQGGLISLQPIRVVPRSLKKVNNTSVYPVTLNVADTMCHAPVGLKKLKNLGDVVGISKVDIPDTQKAQMLQLLENDPTTFLEYASTDSVVTLMYSSALYGYNNTPPVTITSATANVMKGLMMEYFNVNNTNDFNGVYRGLKRDSHGNFKLESKPGYIEASSWEPINDKANSVQYYASKAYHGGYNSCSEVGYFNMPTFDYDLRNAYSTAMCLIPDIDWKNPVKSQIQNQNMMLGHFNMGIGGFNPLIPFIGYVRFKFPDTVKYPCIPVEVDGIPIYPKTSDGLEGVYVAGPHIYLALRLGAEVFCENGYFLNTLITPDFMESRSLGYAVVQLVKDRDKAIEEHGKKSLEELILKTMVNSGYGKNAQNVIQKKSWIAYKDLMEDLGCSAITNPFSAMMTTAIVQCELLAVQNQLYERSYKSCSVTTDGFISDCPFEVLKSLDLYGFRAFMEQARLFLTNGIDSEIWEMKHHQNDLINFTTRGNVSLLPYGVCAHNSAKSGFESDSYEDRLWLMTEVLSRTGTVDCTDDKWATFKDVVQGKSDFKITPQTRHLHMDFDLKRKPDRDSFATDYPVVNGTTYEIAHFDTIPYDNVEEFRLYRKKKKLCNCLRTQAEWQQFFLKVDTNACGMNVKDLDWSILMSIIMGYRMGKWKIPSLDDLTISEKCNWINKHNTSEKKFTVNDWKNCRRPERQVNMLPDSYLKDKLLEMQSDI